MTDRGTGASSGGARSSASMTPGWCRGSRRCWSSAAILPLAGTWTASVVSSWIASRPAAAEARISELAEELDTGELTVDDLEAALLEVAELREGEEAEPAARTPPSPSPPRPTPARGGQFLEAVSQATRAANATESDPTTPAAQAGAAAAAAARATEWSAWVSAASQAWEAGEAARRAVREWDETPTPATRRRPSGAWSGPERTWSPERSEADMMTTRLMAATLMVLTLAGCRPEPSREDVEATAKRSSATWRHPTT